MSATFRQYLRGQGLSEGSIDCYHRIVRRLGNDDPRDWLIRRLARAPAGTATTHRAAVRWWLRYQGLDPDALDLPRGRRPRRVLREPLSREELRSYYAASQERPDPARAVLTLLPKTGQRISELCNLRLSDVRMRQRIRGFQFVGKGGHERFVPLSASAAAELDRWLDVRSCDQSWLFPGQRGACWADRPIHPATIRAHCRIVSEAIGRRVHPHALRHTWATEADRAGIGVRTIQAVLGHSSPNTTMIYLHPDADRLLAAVEAVNL